MTGIEMRGLSVPAYSNGFTHWHYRTSHQLADLLTLGYFADAQDMIKRGDMMMVSAQDGGAQLFFHRWDRPEVMSATSALTRTAVREVA